MDACLSALDSAQHHLTQSVTLLRQAGTQHHLPVGLLHRAALWRELGLRLESLDLSEEQKTAADYFALAERDLSEAETIAERGSMLIWQIEAALERTRLFLTLHDAGWEGKAPAEPQHGDRTDGSAGASPWADELSEP